MTISRPVFQFVSATPVRAFLAAVLLTVCVPVLAAERYFDASFRAEIRPRRTTILVELKLTGERLPSKVNFHIDPKRQRTFISKDPITRTDDLVTWSPRGPDARLTYEFVATHEHSTGRYDSIVTNDWALFRGDKLIPRMTVTSRRGLKGRTTLTFDLPTQWSAVTAYPEKGRCSSSTIRTASSIDRSAGCSRVS